MSETQKPNHSETDRGQPRSVSPYKAGFSCACPNCGDAPLYNGLLEVKPACEACGFDLSDADPGDGAQVFVIFILGALTALLGIFLYGLGLPKLLLMTILTVFIIGGTIWMLRVIKATLLALQYHHDAREGQLEDQSSESKHKDV